MIDPQAVSALRDNQRQLDMEGSEVGVSRQALDELLQDHEELQQQVEDFKRLVLPIFMGLCEKAMIDGEESIPEDLVLLNFMGSGASDFVTVRDFKKAMRIDKFDTTDQYNPS